MDLEINESNRRAIRIMGYNQITITEENRDELFETVLTVVHQQLICFNGEKKNDDHLPNPA